MKVSVVIPVYNERAFIEEVLLRVQASPIEKEIILVDDKSTDGTRGLLEDLDKAQSEGKREVAALFRRHRLLWHAGQCPRRLDAGRSDRVAQQRQGGLDGRRRGIGRHRARDGGADQRVRLGGGCRDGRR